MKRISIILAALVLVLSTPKASAFVGGPFDNGDFNALLDNSGVYQAAFRFTNGSGFAQFGNNVTPSLFQATGAAATAAPSTTYSILNRSVFYYKGVTYLGTCLGMVDHEAKVVHGICNGNSDITTSQTAVVTGSGTTFANTSNLNTNGLGFPCNAHFVCKITESYPILKFKGTGELTIINPTIAQVTYAAISAAIIAGPIAGAGGGGVGGGAAPAITVGDQIQDILDAVSDPAILSSIPSAQITRAASDHTKMDVFGSRIFFAGTR